MNLTSIQTNSGLPSWLFASEPAVFIQEALPYVFGAAGIILIFMIISSGYQMMVSQGEPKAFQAAQGKLTTSVIGILIIFVSFFIVQLILRFFGLELTV